MNPYLFVSDPEEMISFLEKAFDAKEVSRTKRSSNGEIANVILQIGDSIIMLSQGNEQLMTKGAGNYLYVNDVEEAHRTAISAGASEMFGPALMPYGEMQSGIVDPSGNYWWISRRMEEVPYQKYGTI